MAAPCPGAAVPLSRSIAAPGCDLAGDAQPAGEGAKTSLAHAILDALPQQIAVLDVDGSIVAVNAAWRHFAQANARVSVPPASDIGTNYLAVCRAGRLCTRRR